uniref:Uncharacterized protein n=1 Tax=Romanomermis culicivorax TaxID=13658 RepID=A0A915JVC2_ROMCU
MADVMELKFSKPEQLLPAINSSENDEAGVQNPVYKMVRLERENMQILQIVKHGFSESRKYRKKLVTRTRRINHEIQFIQNENQTHELEILRCLQSLSKSSAVDRVDYRNADEFLVTVTETIEKFKFSIPGLENDAVEYARKIEEIENKILEYGLRINQMKHVGDYWSQVLRMLDETLKSLALRFQLKTGIEVESDNDCCQLFANCIERFSRLMDNFKEASAEKDALTKKFDDYQIELTKLKANIDPESSDSKSFKFLCEKWYRELVSISLQGYG